MGTRANCLLPLYAFEEIPAVFGDVPDENLSLTTPIVEIARLISGQRSLGVAQFAPNIQESELLRLEILRRYLRTDTLSLAEIVERAEKTYNGFNNKSKELMKRLILRLIQVGVGSSVNPVTASIQEFDATLQGIAQLLASRGLLTIDQGNVFIADRKLIEGWVLLGEWARKHNEFLVWASEHYSDSSNVEIQ